MKPLRVVMTTWIHSGCLNWVQRWATKTTESEDLVEETISAAGEGRLEPEPYSPDLEEAMAIQQGNHNLKVSVQ